MKVISPNRPVFTENFVYKPFCRYIVSEYEAVFLVNNTPQTNWTCSSFNSYERRYGGQDLSGGKRVAIYRHTAWGDQLMISSLPRFLKTKYPDAEITLYCDWDVLDLWKNNPFVGGAAVPIPIPFEVARAYDYHIFFEGMLENNGESDQDNCYDDAFAFIGIKDVPPEFKRPCVTPRPEDYAYVNKEKLDLSQPYIVYHVSPANKNRCYPPELGAQFVKMFLKAHPDYRVVCVGNRGKEHMDLFKMGGVVDAVDKTKNFRDLIPMVEFAKAVVCPDSSILHLAACYPQVPIVSLWGIFHSNDRAKYYMNNHPLSAFEVCKWAPCHNHDFTLPLHKCTQSSGWKDGQQYCQALSSITPEMILDKVEEVMR